MVVSFFNYTVTDMIKVKSFFKKFRFKIYRYLLRSCFKSELKENIMKKYYVSYVIINPSVLNTPIPGDKFIDIDGKMTATAIKNIKKEIVNEYLAYVKRSPGLNGNVSVVLTCITDVTKEEIDNAFNNGLSKNLDKEPSRSTKDYFMPGAVEVINGKKYIGGKEIVDEK